MSKKSSKTAVLSAIAANFTVMVAKFIGFAFTFSGALLSEGIHTAADLLNQILLYIGIRRSGKNSDAKFEYGYGSEQYVWALISAVGIFFLGCGVTVYHGIHTLISPPEVHENLTWAIVILVISFFVEGAVLFIAVRGVKLDAGDNRFFDYLKQEADPSTVAVILEDSAACLGVVIALVAIVLTKITGETYWDAIGSLMIGCLLGAIAIFLISRNHTLLVGPSIPQNVRNQIYQILSENDIVESVVDLRTRVLDSETYRIKADLEFDGEALAIKKEGELKAAYEKITNYQEFRAFVIQFSDELIELLGDEIDKMEDEIREKFPKAQYLDLEAE